MRTLIVQYSREAADKWQDGAELDMAREMMHLTLRIAGKTLLGSEVEGEADEIGNALTDALGLSDRLTVPIGELLDRIPLPSTRRLWRARAKLDATIHRNTRERRASRNDEGDLLSTLLRAQDEEGDGRVMTDEEIRDEILTIFLAGHETTANALGWTWYLLSQNPGAEQALHRELDAVLGGRPPTSDDYSRLSYTQSVIAESMRLYPPAWVIGREPLSDFDAGGYRVRANTIVLLSPWVLHRDPRFFADPLRFKPERWVPEMDAALPRFIYFPFGGGVRKCIGEGFAWTEGVLVLATLAQHWKARTVAGHLITPEPLITLRMRNGARMMLERGRNSVEAAKSIPAP